MKFDKSHYLKWISYEDIPLDYEQTFVNKCVFYVSEKQTEKSLGFTFFECNQLNQDFFDRLEKRFFTGFDVHKYNFYFYAPELLKNKINRLVTEEIGKHINYIQSGFVNVKNQSSLHIRTKIRVINVDDSSVILKFLKNSFGEMSEFEVVGQFSNPLNCLPDILKLSPDMMTMDIQMPGKSGVELVSEILEKKYIPIIMISSLTPDEGPEVFKALNNGAFDYIQKPRLEDRQEFVEKIKESAFEALRSENANFSNKNISYRKKPSSIKLTSQERMLWCIGSSTGGTQALTRIMTNFPTEIPPVLIVQHIPPVFSKSFADTLNQLVPFTVKEAEDGDVVKSNTVYIAPGGLQMGVEQKAGIISIKLSDTEKVNRFKPSVDYLFKSIASSIKGYNITACILTGMGKDGAEGLLELKKAGAKTFAQDEASSAVYGMPRAAYEIGATDKQVSLDEIAEQFLLLNRDR